VGVGIFCGRNVWGKGRSLLKFLPKQLDYYQKGYELQQFSKTSLYVRKIFLMDDILQENYRSNGSTKAKMNYREEGYSSVLAVNVIWNDGCIS